MRNFKIFNLNPFNEKLYLTDNRAKISQTAHLLQNDQMLYFKDKSKEKKDNYELIELYHYYLQNILTLLDSLNIAKTDLERAIIIEYFLKSEIITIEPISNDFKLKFYTGVNAILGSHNSECLSKLYFDLFKNRYDYPLEYYAYKSANHSIKTHTPNTVINLAEHDNTLYGINLLDKKVYTFINNMEMKSINSSKKEYLRYKPYMDILTKNKSIYDIKNYLEVFKYNVIDFPLTLDEYQILHDRIYKELNIQSDIIHDFKNQQEPLLNEFRKVLSQK